MASAKKCDRCGGLYEAPICNNEYTITRYIHPFGDSKIDLCPACYSFFVNWLMNEKKGE